MNRLADSHSPYLRQHASNPVDWYEWGREAFDTAREAAKPVMISIGYASCHWCHVMAHESFEDPATAQLLNTSFVNVKVDREERPDIDAVYMEANQAMTGQGGWPMTIFTDPEGRPFFAGTYFPREPYGDLPSFGDLITGVADAWANRRNDVETQAAQLHQAIEARTSVSPTARGFDLELVDVARRSLLASHDREWGGFGGAPKFPHSSAIDLLLQLGDRESLDAAVVSLDAMASGGVHDHIGGGFARYSTDAFWMVPHFEKMLYDQAGLLRSYTRAFLVTGEERFAQVATEIVTYVLRDLTLPGGAFASSEDADSEGEEGRFYLWRIEEVEAVVGPDAAAKVVEWYGMTRQGNFEGSNILHRPKRGDLVRSDILDTARSRLLAARNTRVRPGLDDKALTEWNAMFISSLAEAAGALRRPEWLGHCITAARRLLDVHRDATGRWLRTPSGVPAFAGDHAWLVDAFTRLGEATGDPCWLQYGIEAADQMLHLFWDDADGGFFTVGSDAEQLIVRNKDLFDGATSSANSTAAVALARLGALTDRRVYVDRAEQTVTLVADQMRHHAVAFPNMAIAVELLCHDMTETVIAGSHDDLVEAVRTRFLPRNVLLWGGRDDSLPLWSDRDDGAYVCKGRSCGPVARTVDDLLRQLA